MPGRVPLPQRGLVHRNLERKLPPSPTGASFNRTHRIAMLGEAKVMDARAGLSRTGVDPHSPHVTQRYGHDTGRPHATATQGDKHVIVLNCSSAIQIPL